MTALVAGVAGILGLLVGSFLNVVIVRVPRGGSVVRPRSQCPQCAAPVAARDNVPVLSWLRLRGRCRACAAPIPVRYPIVEVLTAGLWGAVAVAYASSWALPAYLFLAAALVAISAIDIELLLIPNRIVYPTAGVLLVLLALASAGEGDWPALGRALLGAGAAGGFLGAIHVVAPGQMGFGDVRLAAVLGLALGWLGWGEVALGCFLGFAYGAAVGLVLVGAGLRGRRQPLPFGPFLAAGALTMVLAGAPLLDWYAGLGG